jgi:N-acetyl-alpha-D-muramate 1-phosphate uridylyltransferase
MICSIDMTEISNQRPPMSSPATISSAMILAAGMGSRMRPITSTIPKPLVKVAGKALVDYILAYCRDGGVQNAVVNVHYLADQMEAHLRKVNAPRITISDERAQLLDSGGGVRKALPLLGSAPFFILNADAVWLDNLTPALNRLKAQWNPATMDVLLLLAHAGNATGWSGRGDFSMETSGQLQRPKPDESPPHIYAGAGIWKPELFADRPEIFSLNRIFDEAIARGRLHGLPLDSLWMHVGTPDAIPEAEAALAKTILVQAK